MTRTQGERPIRVIFMGSPEFAVPSLHALHGDPRFVVPLAVSQPDRPAGRGRRLTPPAVAAAAMELGLTLYQPESLREENAAAPLREAQPDVLVVVAYGELLRRHVLTLAPHQCLNVHPSLLPRYRGAAPLQSAVLNGDQDTGVSIMRLVRKLDAGPVLAQRVVALDATETTGSLSERLAQVAAEMLPDVVANWVAGRITEQPQADAVATHTHEWTVADAQIKWAANVEQIERLVRAAQPWPVAWTSLDGERLRIHAASVATGAPAIAPGAVHMHQRRVLVGTGSTPLELVTVQAAGRKAMAAGDWWRGMRVDEAHFDSQNAADSARSAQSGVI